LWLAAFLMLQAVACGKNSFSERHYLKLAACGLRLFLQLAACGLRLFLQLEACGL
jgi:hypothetical protein